jgi:BASS family bile acid:Na+ symporter
VNAQQLFNATFDAALVIMVAATVAGLGMSFTVKQVLAPLKHVWLVVGVVVVNALLAPLAAIAVCHLLPLDKKAAIGMELTAIAAAGPSAIKAAEMTKRADLAMAMSLIIVLNLVNLVAVPLWAGAIVSGATVRPLSIFGHLLLVVLVPLVVGMILHARYPEHCPVWQTSLLKASNYALIAVLALGIAPNWKLIVSVIGSWVLLASVLIVAVCMAVGWIVAFRSPPLAIGSSLITLNRFGSIGFVVISTVLNNQGAYLAPALVFGLLITVCMYASALEVGRRPGRATPSRIATA